MNQVINKHTNFPLVTIVVPAYNVAPYLEECVQSLLEQTYDNIEIILVDDGSTDDTGKICDSLSNPKIQVIHKENGGLSSARNAGIEKAKGEYIAFVDSDDYVAADYVKVMLQMLLENDGDIAVCGFVRTEKRKAQAKERIQWEQGIHIKTGKEALNELYSASRLYYVVSWNKLYKTSLFEQIRYPVGMLHEDEAVIHKLYHAAHKIVLSREPLYYYYMSDASIMRGTYKIQRMGILYTYLERMSMFAADGNSFMEENSCKQCMVAALMHYYFCRKENNVSCQRAEECLGIYKQCKATMKKATHISWKYKLFFKMASLCPYIAGKLVDIKCNRFYKGE